MPEKHASFIEHLEELRKRILYSIACVILFSIAGFFFAPQVLDRIIQRSTVESVYFFSPMEAFTIHIKIALCVGILVSFPFILHQTWLFIGPGLTRREQNVSLFYLCTGIVLFALGNLFGYFILIPFGLRFLLSFGSEYLQPFLNVSQYLNFVIWCLLGTGFLFQLPLLLFSLMKLGIIDVTTVAKHRPEALIAILVICAIITPSGDFFTLLVIAVPLILLFELSILAARLTQKKHEV